MFHQEVSVKIINILKTKSVQSSSKDTKFLITYTVETLVTSPPVFFHSHSVLGKLDDHLANSANVPFQ